MIRAKYDATCDAVFCRAEIGANMIKIIISDDDSLFLENLRNLIRAELKKQNLDAIIHTYDSREKIPQQVIQSCNIAFLDVDYQSKQYTGIDIARDIRKARQECVIIFVTNYIEYAPEGYEVQAFRYLLKKEVDSKLGLYLQQAIARMQTVQDTFQVTISGESLTILLADILFIEAQSHSAIIHAQKPGNSIIDKYRFYSSLKSLDESLSSRGFLRIQKSFLVNMRRIKKFQCSGVELDNGTVLPISEKNYSEHKMKYLLWKGRK